MTIERFDNPAWRLSDLIEDALRAPNGTLTEFWAAAFHVDRKNVSQIFRSLVTAHRLIDETEALVRRLDLDHAYYLQNFPRLREAFSFTNLDISASSAVNLLSGVTLRDLGFLARSIESTNFALRLANEDLSDLMTDVDAVINEVVKASIDDDLRRVVLDSLEGIRRAISEYRLRGNAGLQEEVERMAARLARYADDLKDSEESSWVSHVVAILVKVDKAAQTGKKYLPLLKAGSQLLLHAADRADA
jgi:hypothetical protein